MFNVNYSQNYKSTTSHSRSHEYEDISINNRNLKITKNLNVKNMKTTIYNIKYIKIETRKTINKIIVSNIK